MRAAHIVAVAGLAISASAMANPNGPIYNNGPLSTGPTTLSGVAAPAGFTWSEVPNDMPTQSNTSAGFSSHPTGTTGAFRLADDFTVPVGEVWNISGFCTYGYQTGSAATATPIGGGTMNVWNGRPGDVGSVIIGIATYGAMTNTNMYRIFNTVAPPPGSPSGTTRLIRQVDWTAALSLGPGTYWVDFQHTPTTAGTTVFVPSVSIPGVRGMPGWNGRQFTTTGWVDAIDAGNPSTLAPDYVQEHPFVVKGKIIPTPGAATLLAIGGLVAARRRRA
jgi:hypothetical protein